MATNALLSKLEDQSQEWHAHKEPDLPMVFARLWTQLNQFPSLNAEQDKDLKETDAHKMLPNQLSPEWLALKELFLEMEFARPWLFHHQSQILSAHQISNLLVEVALPSDITEPSKELPAQVELNSEMEDANLLA